MNLVASACAFGQQTANSRWALAEDELNEACQQLIVYGQKQSEASKRGREER